MKLKLLQNLFFGFLFFILMIAVKLSDELKKYAISHQFITTTGTASNHMLGGMPNALASIEPITYNNEAWVDEVKEWINQYLE
jgi:hypothetical protein